MAKFNVSKIKGLENTAGVGMGLLNAASQAKAVSLKKSEYISADDIIPNERNKMSMNGIEELAQLIELSGLEQPLVVRQREDGKYVLLTGHRRFAAIQILIERGKWNDEKLIEVKVKNLDDVELPLNEEMKEMFSILVTNQQREKTDADIAFEIKNWKEIIAELRIQNVDVMDIGYDEAGNAIQRVIKGEKTQKLVAEQVGISPAQVAKFEKVDNQGSEALKKALLQNSINVNTAAEVAGLEKQEQEQVIEKALEKKDAGELITKDDVRKATHEIKHKAVMNPPEEDEEAIDGVKITEKIFKTDIKSIIKTLKDADGVVLDDKNYAAYLRKIEEIKNLIQ